MAYNKDLRGFLSHVARILSAASSIDRSSKLAIRGLGNFLEVGNLHLLVATFVSKDQSF